MLSLLKNEDRRTLLFLGISFAALIISFFDIGRFSVDAAWIAILCCGIQIIKGAVIGLVTEFDVKADVLVSLALIAAILIGEIFAAGEVAFIMTIGAYLENRTVAKARAGIERLARLSPVTARVVRDRVEYIIPAEQVKLGDTLRVLAGETIAVDGVITKGQTSIDQSVMTGESMPVDKAEGDEVKSGTVNQFGTFEMTAHKVGEDSSLQRMIRLVESADAGKAKIVGIADRWATWIVVVALVSAAVTWIVTGEAIRAVTILVVFCPCALVLATPTAIMAGIGNATKHGILVSEGDALERLAAIKHIAFDKTGTLTFGQPAVTKAESCHSGISNDELFSLAASAELCSEHPLGKAIISFYRKKYGFLPDEPDFFRLIPGKGVCAEVEKRSVYAGNISMMRDCGVKMPGRLEAIEGKMKSDGCTIIYIAVDGVIAGIVALSDTVRPEAADTIKEIHNAGAATVLLTGDTALAANYIARITGVADVKSDYLPEDKMAFISDMQSNGQPVCMVGDGINDAPALKAAHVGIAMGGIGSDIAIDAADIVLVGDDVKEIPHLLRLSRKTMRTININIFASMALNFIAIGLAISGSLNPVLGALVHNVGSVAVIINSSLLLNYRRGR